MVVGENTKNSGQYEGFIQEQLDAETICDKTAMILRGYRFDPNKQDFTNKQEIDVWDQKSGAIKKVTYITKPLLNEEGIQAVIGELRSRIANVFGAASLTGVQITTSRHAVAEILWRKLRHNRDQYDLSLDNMESVLFIVDDQLLFFLSRTEKGGFLKALGKMIGRKENVNLNVNEDGKAGSISKGGFN